MEIGRAFVLKKKKKRIAIETPSKKYQQQSFWGLPSAEKDRNVPSHRLPRHPTEPNVRRK